MSQVESFVEHLSNKIVNDQVFPKIESGFGDSEPVIREKTVISMIHLAPKLNYSNLDETVVMKHFTKLARDEQGGIRTNTTVCLGKIARLIDHDLSWILDSFISFVDIYIRRQDSNVC